MITGIFIFLEVAEAKNEIKLPQTHLGLYFLRPEDGLQLFDVNALESNTTACG